YTFTEHHSCARDCSESNDILLNRTRQNVAPLIVYRPQHRKAIAFHRIVIFGGARYRAKEHVMRHLSLLLAALIFSAPLSSDAQGYHVIKQTLLGGEGNWDYVTVDP